MKRGVDYVCSGKIEKDRQNMKSKLIEVFQELQGVSITKPDLHCSIVNIKQISFVLQVCRVSVSATLAMFTHPPVFWKTSK